MNTTNTQDPIKLALPFAVFDEFGKGADDRVLDHIKCVVAAQLAASVPVSAYDRLQALCDSQAERILNIEDAKITLPDRIDELVNAHGSLRAAATALNCDAGYLSRLRCGAKTDPGDDLLSRMGLRRVVTYEFMSVAAAQPQGDARNVVQPELQDPPWDEAGDFHYNAKVLQRYAAREWALAYGQECFAAGMQAASTQASEPVPINYVILHDFAQEKRVSYNDLCATVRLAIDSMATPARAVEPLTQQEINEALYKSDEGQEESELPIAFAYAAIDAFCRKNGIGIPSTTPTQAAQGGEDHLKLHAIEELCQLGYTVKDGQLVPPDHLHKLMIAAGHPLAASHLWSDDGERCLKCGDKDWMGGPCSVPDAAATQGGEA